MPLIILDRDGVINHESNQYIKTQDEWIPLPGSLAAIARLNQAGYHVVVATNQSGLARGYFTETTLADIHDKMHRELTAVGGKLAAVFICPHHPDDGCGCRKPKPGLLFQIQQKYELDLSEVYFIGDSFTDIQAGHKAGCKPLLVLTGNGKKVFAENTDNLEAPAFNDLAHAVEFILNGK